MSGFNNFVILKESQKDNSLEAILGGFFAFLQERAPGFQPFLEVESGSMKGQVLGYLHQVAAAKAGESQERFSPMTCQVILSFQYVVSKLPVISLGKQAKRVKSSSR